MVRYNENQIFKNILTSCSENLNEKTSLGRSSTLQGTVTMWGMVVAHHGRGVVDAAAIVAKVDDLMIGKSV